MYKSFEERQAADRSQVDRIRREREWAENAEPGSREADVARMLSRHRITLPRIPLSPKRLVLTEAHNQNPTTLLFRDGELLDRRLGAQTLEQLFEWVSLHQRSR